MVLSLGLRMKKPNIQITIKHMMQHLLSNGHEMTEVVSEMLFISSDLVRTKQSNVIGLNEGDDLFGLDEQEDSDLEYAHDCLKELKKDVNKVKRQVEKGKVDKHNLWYLESTFDCFFDEFSTKICDQIRSDYEIISNEYAPWKRKANRLVAKSQLNELSKRIIHTIASVKSIIREYEEFKHQLDSEDAEVSELVRNMLSRCARYRSEKKLQKALVQLELGKTQSYMNQIIEARHILEQDWMDMIGGKPPASELLRYEITFKKV